jgi:hypothetical protein
MHGASSLVTRTYILMISHAPTTRSYGLSERVCQLTHCLRHQLDTVVTSTEHRVVSVRVDPPSLLSDHSLITLTFDVVAKTFRAYQ